MLRTHAFLLAAFVAFAVLCTGCHHWCCHSCAPKCGGPACCLPPKAPCCQAPCCEAPCCKAPCCPAPPKAACCGECGHRCCVLDWLHNHCCSCNSCCHPGCGEVYWCEWVNDPPDCCDPCDPCYGCWTGPRDCCHKIIIDPLLWVLSLKHRICLHPWERCGPCEGCGCPYGYDCGCYGGCCAGGCDDGCGSGCCAGPGEVYYNDGMSTQGSPVPVDSSPGGVHEIPDPALSPPQTLHPRTALHTTENVGVSSTGRFVR
jgi:hypothetical protein